MSYFPLSSYRNPLSSSYSHNHFQTYHAYKLKVAGTGKINVKPDMAVVVLGVSTENKELELAQKENAKIIKKITDALKKTGVSSEDIQTQSYTISPQYDYVDGKQIFRNYKVVHTLKITIEDIDQVGEIIDTAVKKGANIVNNISFTLSDPSKYYQIALTAAIDDALKKAMTIGKKLNVDVSKTPLYIVEKNYQYASPVEYSLAKGAEMTTPIQVGQIHVIAEIEAVFHYTPM